MKILRSTCDPSTITFHLRITALLVCLLSCLFIGSSLLTACSDTARLQILDSDATILAYGDSLTYGTGTSRDKAYPAILEQLTGHHVINAGIPGEISSSGVRRLRGLLEQYQPALVIICHGGNDILKKLDTGKTQKNIQQMIELAQQHNSQVVLIGVPAFGLFLDTAAFYETLAADNHIPADNESLGEIISDNRLKSDHIHPNTAGYHLLANNIAELLKRSGAIQTIGTTYPNTDE